MARIIETFNQRKIEKEQSAVEFIETELRKLNISTDSGTSVSVIRILEQAKAMEKEQITNAFGEGIISAISFTKMNGNEYYNKTFKSE